MELKGKYFFRPGIEKYDEHTDIGVVIDSPKSDSQFATVLHFPFDGKTKKTFVEVLSDSNVGSFRFYDTFEELRESAKFYLSSKGN